MRACNADDVAESRFVKVSMCQQHVRILSHRILPQRGAIHLVAPDASELCVM
jgi:hypothetical protein